MSRFEVPQHYFEPHEIADLIEAFEFDKKSEDKFIEG